jgi:two-component system chemotaxis response regulator CheY
MTVLVVDDSKAMRMIVRRTLRQAGYENLIINEAANGAEALRVFTETRPNLILCDWNMPEMSGLELLNTLKQRGDICSFGFVTSESTAMREKALSAGASFLITKPFSADSFKAVLDRFLARS